MKIPLNWLTLTGAPRSGTSLLLALVNQHPHVFVLPEYGSALLFERSIALNQERYFADYQPPTFSQPSTFHHPPLLYNINKVSEIDDQVFLSPSWLEAQRFYERRVRTSNIPLVNPTDREESIALTVKTFIRKLSRKRARLRYIGDKMPIIAGSTHDIDVADQICATNTVICIVRNPLDVINSSLERRNKTMLMQDDWHVADVRTAAHEWAAAWFWVKDRVSRNSALTLVVKYEDLVRSPITTMTTIWDFLGLSYYAVRARPFKMPEHLRGFACSATERAYIDSQFQTFDDWHEVDIAELLSRNFEYLGVLRNGEVIDFTQVSDCDYGLKGFSAQESWGRWTDGNLASLRFRHIAGASAGSLEITFCGAYSPSNGAADIQITAGMSRPAVSKHRIPTSGPSTVKIAFNFDNENTGTPIRLEFKIKRPKELSQAPLHDTRRLGVQISSIKFESS